MIVFFVGSPGSGKSYEAVKKIVDNLRLGRVVCTNIDGMDEQVHQEYLKNQLDFDDYRFSQQFRFLSKEESSQFWMSRTEEYISGGAIRQKNVPLYCPPGSLIIIDEVHKLFNARDWQKKENRDLADWASTHRHEGYDVVFITQDIEKVEKQVRSLTEWTYFFRKVNFLGSAVSKKYLCYGYTGGEHSGRPLTKNVRTYNPKYFPCYKSYATKDAKELGFMTHVNILKHPIFFAIPVVLAFCVYMFSKSSLATGDIFGTEKVMKESQARIHSAQVKPPSPVPFHPVSSSRSNSNPQPPVTPFQPVSSVRIIAAEEDSSRKFVFGRGGYMWTDRNGVTHLTNQAHLIPPGVNFKEL